MKLRYDTEDDVLMVWLAEEKVDHAQQKENVIIHFSSQDVPVLLEILGASEFLREVFRSLPEGDRQRVSA